MTPLARTWLRRIALGLPLVTLPGCFPTGSCPPPITNEIDQPLTTEQIARLRDGGLADGGAIVVSPSECAILCEQLHRESDAGTFLHADMCAVSETDGGLAIACHLRNFCLGGRRPAGLVDVVARSRSAVGDFLARSAHLEAASVPAFVDLARELELHGSPGELAAAARRSAAAERRHARAIGALAQRYGATPAAVERENREPRDVIAMAEDNAVEGCVREAYAAIVAAHQAVHAGDPAVRTVMAGIARDEARHALLSFAIDDWSTQRVGGRGARAADDRRREAVSAFAIACEMEADASARAALGLPCAEIAVEIARALA
jgi:hypothetical protein